MLDSLAGLFPPHAVTVANAHIAAMPRVVRRRGTALHRSDDSRKLRLKLRGRGHTLKTESTMTSSAQRRFVDQDDSFVHALNGMSAIAICGCPNPHLKPLRDRVGTRPANGTETANGRILFASEIKALFAAALVTSEVDGASKSLYLAYGDVFLPHILKDECLNLPANESSEHGADQRPQGSRNRFETDPATEAGTPPQAPAGASARMRRP